MIKLKQKIHKNLIDVGVHKKTPRVKQKVQTPIALAVLKLIGKKFQSRGHLEKHLQNQGHNA